MPAGTANKVLLLLRAAFQLGASDLLLRAGRQPRLRVDGQLRELDHAPLDAAAIDAGLAFLLGRTEMLPERLSRTDLDFACSLPELGRLRVHAYRMGGGPALEMRCLPADPPSLSALWLPPVVKQLASARSGLVLIAGEAGSGRSTTAASMLRYIGSQLPRHIVTLEQPVEYVLRDNVAAFSQRGLGRDVRSRHEGLRSLRHEDPDVMYVDRVTDRYVLEALLDAADAGILVLATLDAPDVQTALTKLIGPHDGQECDNLHRALQTHLRGVIAQRLLRRGGSRGRVLVTEVCLPVPGVMECLRRSQQLPKLTEVLEANVDVGCHSFAQVVQSMRADGVLPAADGEPEPPAEAPLSLPAPDRHWLRRLLPPTDRPPGPVTDPWLAVFEAASEVDAAPDAVEALRHACGMLLATVACDGVAGFLYDINADLLRCVAAAGQGDPRVGHVLPTDRGLLARALRLEDACSVFTDMPHRADFDRDVDGWPGSEVHVAMLRPLSSDGRLVGLVQLVGPHQGGSFSAFEEGMVDYLAARLTDAIDALQRRC